MRALKRLYLVRTARPDLIGFERTSIARRPSQYKQDPKELQGYEDGKVEFDHRFNIQKDNLRVNKNNVKLMTLDEPETVDEYINDRIQSEVKKHHKIKFNCVKKWCELFCATCTSKQS